MRRITEANRVTFAGKKLPIYDKIIIKDFIGLHIEYPTDIKVRTVKPTKSNQSAFVDIVAILAGSVPVITIEDSGTRRFLQGLAHELTHVNQSLSGDLHYDSDNIIFKGKKYDLDTYKQNRDYKFYLGYPWEAEAVRNSTEWVDKYIANDFKKLRGQDSTIDFIIDNDLM
jgi:hypothetical protein